MTPSSTNRTTWPLSGRTRALVDLPAAELVGRRLAEELRAAFEAAGWPARSARSVARQLGVDPNLCQRATVAARCASSPLEVLLRTPGVTGLQQLKAAFSRKKFDRHLVEALGAATAQLDQLIEQSGGSLEQLREALTEAGAASARPADSDPVRERRAAYGAMAACAGCRVDTHAVTVFLRPGTGNRLEGFSINSYIGWQSSPGGIPLLLSFFGDVATEPVESEPVETEPVETEPVESDASPTARLDLRGRILERYSTQPAPMITLHKAAGGVSLRMLDPISPLGESDLGLRPPADICVLNPILGVSDPRSMADRRHTSFVRCRYPSRELIFDVFLTRELSDACKPVVGVYWSGKWLTDGLLAPWHDRLPGHIPLSIFDGVPSANPSEHFASYPMMLREVVDDIGWSKERLVGYRLVVRYPLWGAAHVISLDFSHGTDQRPEMPPASQ